MKKLLMAGVLISLSLSSVYANTCGYEQVKSSEYQLTDLSKKYVTTSFFIDPNKDMLASVQRNEKKYKSLKENKFKVLDTGVVTKYHDRFTKAGLKNYSSDLLINGKAYTLNKALSTKLITSNCEVFYLNLDKPIDMKFLAFQFLKGDGGLPDTTSLLELMGKSLKAKDTSALVSYDRFEKVVNIETKEFNNMLLRGVYSPVSRKTSLVQLYLDATFIGNWGGIKVAYDLDGTQHEVVLINHNADCSNRYMGCKLKETIGVTLSEEFLKKNQAGFELKLKGKQDKIIEVPSDLIGSFLEGLNKAKSEYK